MAGSVCNGPLDDIVADVVTQVRQFADRKADFLNQLPVNTGNLSVVRGQELGQLQNDQGVVIRL